MTTLPDFFSKETKQWFQSSLGEPTMVQLMAWPEIAAGRDTLVSAPTGTGKTLTAFLTFIDRMLRQAKNGELSANLQLIYISPLKSLAADIRENLKRPLFGICNEENEEIPPITVAIRTGDTTSAERQQMLRKPPHILITTPESLYLLLTTKGGSQMLSTAGSIIIDELHAIMETKRGAHLMLSIARLDILHETPLQRIGLSATVKPLPLAAQYLSPGEVAVVAPKMTKKVELQVLSPKKSDIMLEKDSVWRDIAARIYEECAGTRTSIVFVEGRKFAEQLAYYMGALGGDDFARVHHGSLSKEKRHVVEQDLKNGNIRLLIATSTMELGIDVGEIDKVFQVGQPRTISGTMQRLGRAGHSPTKVSVMKMFPRTAEETLYCGMTAEVARNGGIEELKPPVGCYDVLAQHLVSMAANGPYEVSDVLPVLKRAYPFAQVTLSKVRGILRMLSGDYEHEENIPVRPRLLYDRIHDTVEGDAYSRMLAVSSGGTIPDRGMFAVKTESGVKVGEVEEEFVFESRVGDDFLLGSFSWKVQKITRDTVIVEPSSVKKSRLPFWKGEITGRKLSTGMAFGRILRTLESAYHNGTLNTELAALGLDEACVLDVADYIDRQIRATEILPNEKTILMEHFRDETGSYQIMIHSVFGNRINSPLGLLLQEHAADVAGSTVNYVSDDDGIDLFPYDGKRLPQGLLQELSPENAERILSALVIGTPSFNIMFRYNAGRALMMGVKSFKRQPLWVQRVKGAEMLNSIVGESAMEHRQKAISVPERQNGIEKDVEDTTEPGQQISVDDGIEHPLVEETKRECLSDFWDIKGVVEILLKIRSGEIRVREMFLEVPSPMSFLLRKKTEESLMYNYAPTANGVIRTMEKQVASAKNLLQPEEQDLKRVQERKKLPEDEKQLHSLLMIEGDLQANELPVPVEWLTKLIKQEQVLYIEPGLWIAAEQRELYETARLCSGTGGSLLSEAGVSEKGADEKDVNQSADRETPFEEACKSARERIILRLLRFRGEHSVEELAARYLFSKKEAEELLSALLEKEKLSLYNGSYYHRELFDRARTETVKNRRVLTKTEPFSHFAAFVCERRKEISTPLEQLTAALRQLRGWSFTPELFENVIFPARVNGYREELLDKVLSQGEFYYRMNGKGEVSFERYDDADYDKKPYEELTEREGIICELLSKRGASFLTAFSQAFAGEPPYEEILSLLKKGVLCTDSFGPVRYLSLLETVKKMTAKQKAATRAKLLSLGRFDFARPVKEKTVTEQVEELLSQTGVLCRETIKGRISFFEALEVLRIQEYTGQVRRGYFVEGLSGIQFIAEKNYSAILSRLTNPDRELTWLSAADPAQVYGKLAPHMEGRNFLNVAGTCVALAAGVPVAVFERQGKTFRCFEEEYLFEALSVFKKEFDKKTLFSTEKRLLVKEYPESAREAFLAAGFLTEMTDFVIYR